MTSSSTQKKIVAMDLPTCMLSDRPCCRVDCRHTLSAGSYTIADVEERCVRIFDLERIHVGYIGLTTHQPVTRFHYMHEHERDDADGNAYNANHFPRWRAMFVVMVGDRVAIRPLESAIVDRLKAAGCKLANSDVRGGSGVRNIGGVPTALYLCSDFFDRECGCDPCHRWLLRSSPSDDDADDSAQTPPAPPSKRCRIEFHG